MRIKPEGTFTLGDPYEMHPFLGEEFECSRCSSLLEPQFDQDGPVAKDLTALASNAKRLGWFATARGSRPRG